ncbi:MAG: hypothetical protein RLZZ584_2712 [Pseudomonadota bacterium]
MEPSPLTLLLSKNLLIPLAGIFMPLGLVVVWLRFRQRSAQLLHETVRQLASQGQPVPAELFGPARPARPALHQAWTLIGAGVGLIVGLLTLADTREFAGLGAVPLAIGLGQWLAIRTEARTGGRGDVPPGGPDTQAPLQPGAASQPAPHDRTTSA